MRKGRINMLALSRKIGESIMIGNEIEISVLEIKGDQVKLGISAPKSIPVYRREIYVQIQDANKEAAESTVSVDELRKLFK
jgi:carbon storage regulator